MDYFSQFPKIVYDLNGGSKANHEKIVPDIFRRIKIRDKVKENFLLLDKYDVQPGESPETVAFKVYGSPKYWWVICLTNNIVNRFHDWPKSHSEFETYVNDKYTNPGDIHHYEKEQSSGNTEQREPGDFDHMIQVNADEDGAQAVSNYEYEQRLEDKKRQISILNPSYLPSFMDEFKRLVRS